MDIAKLYDYQNTTALNLSVRSFGADLSEVGTGKTITALAVMHMTKSRRILVIAPKSVAEQWERKANEFWPELIVCRPKGSTKQARIEAYKTYAKYIKSGSPTLLVVTYEQVRSDSNILSAVKFNVIYADECHRIGNPVTKLYKSLRLLKSERRFGATATPLRSSPLQAFGIFNWLSPGLLGKNYHHFQFQYTMKNQQGWLLGYKNLDQLGERIKPYFVRNLMADVGVQLPPLIEEEIIFELGASERKLYDDIRKEMLLEIEEKQINKIENPINLHNSVVKLGKLQELTDHLLLLGESDESTKLATLKDHLADTVVGSNKALVFTRFSRMADILSERLNEYNPAIITGAVKDRQSMIDKFDNDDTCKVIIITTAGNEGINLQRGNLLYMYDVPLGSFGSLVQTIGRINRIGQTRKMMVYYLMAKGTVDIKLKKLLETKKDMSDKIFGSLQDIRDMLE